LLTCGYRLTAEEQGTIREAARDRVQNNENRRQAHHLRKKIKSKTVIGWVLLGLAGMFTVDTVGATLDPKNTDTDIVALAIATVLMVGLPGFFGIRTLRQASLLKKKFPATELNS